MIYIDTKDLLDNQIIITYDQKESIEYIREYFSCSEILKEKPYYINLIYNDKEYHIYTVYEITDSKFINKEDFKPLKDVIEREIKFYGKEDLITAINFDIFEDDYDPYFIIDAQYIPIIWNGKTKEYVYCHDYIRKYLKKMPKSFTLDDIPPLSFFTVNVPNEKITINNIFDFNIPEWVNDEKEYFKYDFEEKNVCKNFITKEDFKNLISYLEKRKCNMSKKNCDIPKKKCDISKKNCFNSFDLDPSFNLFTNLCDYCKYIYENIVSYFYIEIPSKTGTYKLFSRRKNADPYTIKYIHEDIINYNNKEEKYIVESSLIDRKDYLPIIPYKKYLSFY